MSYKHIPLAESDILIADSDLFYDALVKYCADGGKDISKVRVLDWGCGRGRYVGFLLSKGIDAYGVDIDPVVLSQSETLFKQNGWDHAARIKLIGQDNISPFDEASFDYIFSDQVFEHVQDIYSLCAELHRVCKKKGMQLHRFPAKYRVIEPHLFMPYVHWIPKGFIRYILILIYVYFKIEPRWKELESKSIYEKASVYYRYSEQKTFYRSTYNLLRVLKKYFSIIKFRSNFNSGNTFLNKLASNQSINQRLGLIFNSVNIYLIK